MAWANALSYSSSLHREIKYLFITLLEALRACQRDERQRPYVRRVILNGHRKRTMDHYIKPVIVRNFIIANLGFLSSRNPLRVTYGLSVIRQKVRHTHLNPLLQKKKIHFVI